jgi:hypothetical protein
MNTPRKLDTADAAASRTAALLDVSQSSVESAPARRIYRERDFGIGYGSSSGYGLDKRYTRDWGQAHFRFC